MNDLINTRFLLNLGMSIYIPVIFVSALYYAIGHFINKENAKILLAGYNFMTAEERKKFDIENYLVSFKSFFKNQAIYSFFIFQICYLLFDKKKSAILLWSLYIIITLVYFLVKSKKTN